MGKPLNRHKEHRDQEDREAAGKRHADDRDLAKSSVILVAT